jgi:uncharacterized FlaG/YvyC family protein
MVSLDKINLIHEFFEANEIVYENIKIEYKDETGFSVVASNDLTVGTTVCKIPKESILSIRNTAIADIIGKF